MISIQSSFLKSALFYLNVDKLWGSTQFALIGSLKRHLHINPCPLLLYKLNFYQYSNYLQPIALILLPFRQQPLKSLIHDFASKLRATVEIHPCQICYSGISQLYCNKVVQMQLNSPREGFQQHEQDHLISKEREKQRQTGLYFKIPQAKPLLSKVHIDHQKPKVLIRDIKMHLEYSELLRAATLPYHATLQRTSKKEAGYSDTTLWERYVLGNNYKCLYMKYNALKLQQNEMRGKRLKSLLLKLTMGNEWLFATYILQMSFLTETTSIMLRNLTSSSLSDQFQYVSSSGEQIGFDSRFEGGNLMYVFQGIDSPTREFHLVLQNDINTKGYANWFFFKVYSAKPGPLRFHIVNLQKNFSYFGQGMKPAVYSAREGKVWKMQATNLSYSKNEMIKASQHGERYNTLTFSIEQAHPNDILFVAASPPYTYSRMLLFLQNAQKQAKSKQNLYFRRQSLATTISSNDCPLVTLTWKRDRKEEKGRKKIVVVIARQHPSEVVSSWVAQGFISGLLAERPQVEELLRKYIFKIVPMVNIDGVIYGNSRCDISGSDCNRKWTKHSNPSLYPTVTAIRKLVTQLIYQGQQVQYFFDLHGHSRKLGSFIYGCKSYDQLQSRMFAWLFSKATERFSFDQCRFGVSPFRRQTARGFIGSILNSKKSMTLQTSFYGYKTSKGELKPFTPSQLQQLGQNLLTAIHWDTFRTSNAVVNWGSVRSQIRQFMQQSKNREDYSEGSDSDPEGEELSAKEKAATFMSPAIASKIGLFDVKVIERPKNIINPHFQQSHVNKVQPINNRQAAKFVESSQIKLLSMSQSLPKHDFQHSKILRQTKSVTKVESFRLKSIDKKEKKRIRIAIDVQRQPRMAAPVLPQVRPRNSTQFWQDLKSEYQTLLNQKKTLLQSAKSHQISNL